MEATIFTGWIYDHLLPQAEAVKVAHPLMLRAIAAAKRKNDRIDAGKIADCLRCDFLPECHMAPTPIRDRRRVLRYRNLVLRQSVQMKNRLSGLLMETGVSYNKLRLHRMGYFAELLATNEEVSRKSSRKGIAAANRMQLKTRIVTKTRRVFQRYGFKYSGLDPGALGLTSLFDLKKSRSPSPTRWEEG